MRRAADFRRAFTWGRPAHRVRRANVSPAPRALTELGRLKAVIYSVNKEGDGPSEYIHEFEAPRPALAMDIDNRRLHVVGGGYTVTRRGIER